MTLGVEPLSAALGARVFGEPEVHVEGRQVDRDNTRYVDDNHFVHVIDSNRNAANF